MLRAVPFFTFLCFASYSFAQTPGEKDCEKLLNVSEIESYLDDAFGPYDTFEQDKDALTHTMKSQGLSDRSTHENIQALEQFSKHVQSIKKPIMKKVKAHLTQKLTAQFTADEIHELIRLLNHPVMKKFKNFSKKVMPEALRIVYTEKNTHLKKPFDDLQKSLVIAQDTPTHTPQDS